MRAFIAIVIALQGASAAFPVAKLSVETTVGGEPVEVELAVDGVVSLRVALQGHPAPIARIVGSTVVANDGRVLASLAPGGRLTIPGLEKTMRLRGCTLIDSVDGEVTLGRDGTFFLKRPGQARFSLPAGVRGDFKRACPTALVLYWMLPALVTHNR